MKFLTLTLNYLAIKFRTLLTKFLTLSLVYRNQVLEYQKWAKLLAKKLLEVLLKGLNVNEFDESLEPFLMGTMAININYYPPCSNPTISFSPSDI